MQVLCRPRGSEASLTGGHLPLLLKKCVRRLQQEVWRAHRPHLRSALSNRTASSSLALSLSAADSSSMSAGRRSICRSSFAFSLARGGASNTSV
jgi:hypothetical protein